MRRTRNVVIVFALTVLFPLFTAPAAVACQEMCVEYEVRTLRGQLLQRTGEPIANAKLIVRDASTNAAGPETFCRARKGPVVLKTKTDKHGKFYLRRLRPGRYWITYRHPEEGESFLVTVLESGESKAFDMNVDSFGGLCYLIDIERNATKPPGWPAPVKQTEGKH